MLINAWKEYGEGGIVAPTRGEGYTKLDAFARYSARTHLREPLQRVDAFQPSGYNRAIRCKEEEMRTLSRAFHSVVLLALVAGVWAQEQVTVQALLTDGQKYDGKQVVLVGTVRNLKEKVSKKGNPYYTFKIGEGKQTISVFGYGKATAKEGDRVRVTGKFAVEKRVGYAIYRNEIDVSKGKVEVLTPAPTDKDKKRQQ